MKPTETQLHASDLFFLFGSGSEFRDYSPIKGWRIEITLDSKKLSDTISLVIEQHDFLNFTISKNINNFDLKHSISLKRAPLEVHQINKKDSLSDFVETIANDSFNPFSSTLIKFHLGINQKSKQSYFACKYHHSLFDGRSVDRIIKQIFEVYTLSPSQLILYKFTKLKRVSTLGYIKNQSVGSRKLYIYYLFGLINITIKLFKKVPPGPFNVYSDNNAPVILRTTSISSGNNSNISKVRNSLRVSENDILTYLIVTSLKKTLPSGITATHIWQPVGITGVQSSKFVGNLITSMQVDISTNLSHKKTLLEISRKIHLHKTSKLELGLTLFLDRFIRSTESIKRIIKKAALSSHLQFGTTNDIIGNSYLNCFYNVQEFISVVPPRSFRQGGIRAGKSNNKIIFSIAFNEGSLSDDLVNIFLDGISLAEKNILMDLEIFKNK
jgi:hypothetical protein